MVKYKSYNLISVNNWRDIMAKTNSFSGFDYPCHDSSAHFPGASLSSSLHIRCSRTALIKSLMETHSQQNN